MMRVFKLIRNIFINIPPSASDTMQPARTCWRCILETLLSIEDAAKRLGGISKWTIHAWLNQGKLRRTKVGGRTMIRESELERFIEAGDGGKSPGRPRAERQ